jgi:hypothetical protein
LIKSVDGEKEKGIDRGNQALLKRKFCAVVAPGTQSPMRAAPGLVETAVTGCDSPPSGAVPGTSGYSFLRGPIAVDQSTDKYSGIAQGNWPIEPSEFS